MNSTEPFSVKYDLVMDDWIEFNAHHFSSSKAHMKQVRTIWFTVGAVGGVLVWVFDGNPYAFGIFALFMILFGYFLYKGVTQGNRKGLMALMGEGGNRHLFGSHVFSVTEEGVTDETEVGRTEMTWEGIERVTVTESQVFVYIGALQAFIIPRRAFQYSEEVDRFVSLLQSRISKENAGSKPVLSVIKQGGSGNFFANVGDGFAKGIGYILALAVILLCLLYLQHYNTRVANQAYKMPEIFGPDSGLEITYTREKKSEMNLEVVGTIENQGESDWQAVQLELNLFDKDDKLIDQCAGFVGGTVSVGESRNFKVVCGGRPESPIEEYQRYELRIVSAYAGQPPQEEL